MGTMQMHMAAAYTLEASLECIELALYGTFQQVPNIQVDIMLLVVISDRLAGPSSFQV